MEWHDQPATVLAAQVVDLGDNGPLHATTRTLNKEIHNLVIIGRRVGKVATTIPPINEKPCVCSFSHQLSMPLEEANIAGVHHSYKVFCISSFNVSITCCSE